MSKFNLDYSNLEERLLNNKRKEYRLADVSHRIEKVAFDVVRFIDSENIDNLWKIEKRDDGEVILAMYSDDEDDSITVESSKNNDWDTAIDKSASYINIFYKGEPITKVDVNKLNIPKEDINLLARSLPSKLASNPNLVTKMINELSIDEKRMVLSKYPELNK